ncbi:MAG: hypothetical protein HY248_04385, partial [Fimbriimonas ginsengisoli]|nr:hypothetical protein [Fimbriimonas ginsengisoli]
RHSIFLQFPDDPAGRFYRDAEFAQVYTRLTSTGKEVYGSVPIGYALEGTSPTESSLRDVWAIFPLPTLPYRAVPPGDIWQTQFQEPSIDLARFHEQQSLFKVIPARGEFVGIEWEMGHPCAKVHQSMAVGNVVRGDQSEVIDETYWFALDKSVIIKFVRTETSTRRIGAAAAGGGDIPVPATNAPTPARPAAPAGGGGRGGGGRGGRGGGFDAPITPPGFFQLGGYGSGESPQRPQVVVQPPTAGATTGGFSASTNVQFERIVFEQTFILAS